MTEAQKTNKVLKTTGMWLIGAGSICVRLGFKLKPQKVLSTTFKPFLSDQTGIKTSSISLSDGYYYLIDWNKWGEIIDLDIIDNMIYKAEKFDCDNFAFLFSSRAASLYNLNSAGVAYGSVFNKDTKRYIGGHAFNVIATKDNGILHLHCYEPMSDKSALIVKGRDIIIGPWIYKPNWLIFF